MKERRYNMYLMNNKVYIIDEADLKKIIDNASEMLVTLKQVMVHPASITAIEPFYVDYRQEYKHTVVDRGTSGLVASLDGAPKPPLPIPDLFANNLLDNGKH